MKKLAMLALVASAGAVMPATAQDSVSNNDGLPGDAPDAFTDPVVTSYILDLDLHFGSWGTEFAVGPVLKAHKTDTNFFTGLTSGQTISQDVLDGVSFAASSYAFWDAAGFGVSGQNTAAQTFETPTGTASQVAVHQASFAGTAGIPASVFEGVQAAIINFDPAEPTRLYVKRVQSATNMPSNGTSSSAALGVGGIDAAGNAILRADDFAGGLPDPVSGNNYFRVRNQDRTTGLNDIDGSNPASLGKEATDNILVGSGTTHTAPAMVPASLGGTSNGAALGGNFNGEVVFGEGPTSATTAHRPAGTPDQRGVPGFSPVTIFPGSVGTGAILGKDDNFDTKQIVACGVDGTGAPVGTAAFTLPDVVSDPCDAFTLDSTLGTGGGGGQPDWEFDHYRGISTFRGPVGIATVGFDPVSGKALVASTVQDRGIFDQQDTPYTAIVVCRFDPANPTNVAAQEWTVAAWTDFDNLTGKPILDGPGGASIGTLIDYDTVTGGTILGPSLSVPSFDSRGNIYFLAGVSLNKVDMMGVPFIDTDTALVRGIYDSANNCYDLELIIEQGNVFQGQNSGLNYQVQFLQVALSNGAAAPSGFWGNSVNPNPLGGVDAMLLDQAAPQAMTGLTLAAQIVYDVNEDEDFNNPTSGGGDPTSPDQAYNVLLYVTSNNPAEVGPICGPADVTTDGTANGIPDDAVTLSDFSFYLGLWSASDAAADLTTDGTSNGIPDGAVTLSDFSFYLGLWSAGCP